MNFFLHMRTYFRRCQALAEPTTLECVDVEVDWINLTQPKPESEPEVVTCVLCHKSHDGKCPLLKTLRYDISRKYYLAPKLTLDDERGFAAAGILAYYVDTTNRKRFLVINEPRYGVNGYNCIAGKRDSLPGAFKMKGDVATKLETSRYTARREFKEECAEQNIPSDLRDLILRQSDNASVLWDPAGMALLIVKVPPWRDGPTFKWVSIYKPHVRLHDFTRRTLMSADSRL